MLGRVRGGGRSGLDFEVVRQGYAGFGGEEGIYGLQGRVLIPSGAVFQL